MGILDSIVEWIATQIMNLLDLVTGSVLGALGCDMSTFLLGLIRRRMHILCIHYYNTRQVKRNLSVLPPMEKHELGLAA